MAIFAKLSSSLIRTLQVLGTLYMIGVTTYFIIKLSKGNGRPDNKALAVEIISGAAVLYASMMLLLAICLLQKHFFQFFTIIMDLLFMGGFIAIAILLRRAPYQSCASSRTTTPNPQWLGNVGGRASINCKLIEGLFGCSIALAFLFFISVLPALLARRSTQKDQVYHDDTPKRGFSGFSREKRTTNVALPTRNVVAPVLDRPSVDTSFTKDTEKGSDVGIGREYNHGYTSTSQPSGLAPPVAAVPVRTVSPLQTELYNNSNNNHINTTREESYRTTDQVRHDTLSHGLHGDQYDANIDRSSELPAHDTNYYGSGVAGETHLDPIDPNVGGVTGKIYRMQMNRIDT